MSARVVAVTQLLLDVLNDLAPKPAHIVTPTELEMSLLFWPLRPDLIQLNTEARAEMGAAVARVLET